MLPDAVPSDPRPGAGELMFALLADARLPTGAHTQSGGLEPALRHGLPPEQVPDYVAARLATVVRVEAGTAVAARHAALAAVPDGGVSGPAALLGSVWAHWEARTPSAALRASSTTLGRGQSRLAARLWSEHPGVLALAEAVRARPAREHPPRALVVGVTAACAGLSAAQTARLVAYEDVQSVAAAMLKLAPVDPVEVTRWVIACAPRIELLVSETAVITGAGQIPACGAPMIELWAEAHARTTERLFSA